MTDPKALIAEAREWLQCKWPPSLHNADKSGALAEADDFVRRLAAALEEATPPEGWRVVYRKDDFEVWQEAPGAWLVADEPRHRDFGDFPTARKAMAALDAQKAPIGLFNQLTPEQQKAALEYRGPEGHGDPAFRRRHEDQG